MTASRSDLADLLSESPPAARLRIAVVTAVSGSTVRTDVTGDAWVPAGLDVTVGVGYRVALLHQGAIAVVVARLT